MPLILPYLNFGDSMGLFHIATGAFHKTLLPRDILRYDNREIEELCYDGLAYGFLKSSTRGKVNKLPAVERTAAIRSAFRSRPGEMYRRFYGPRPIEKPRVLVVVTGGTVLCQVDGGVLKPTLPAESLLQSTPRISDRYQVSVEEVMRKDSSLMSPEDQTTIAKFIAAKTNEHKPDGVVVLHGTDTMCNAAHALEFLIESSPVPIVMTGAMIPLGMPDSDAHSNLQHAFFYASALPLRPGVYVSFAGELFEGVRVVHSAKKPKEAFISVFEEQQSGVAKIYKLEEVVNLIGKSMDSVTPEDFHTLTSIGMHPRILHPSLNIPFDGPSRQYMYEQLVVAKDRLVRRPAEYAAQVRLDAPRPEVIGITAYPETRTFANLIEHFIALENRDLVPITVDKMGGVVTSGIKGRRGLYIGSFSGNVGDSYALALALERGIPIIIGSRLKRETLRQTSAYDAASGIKPLESSLIYPGEMPEDMAVTKLSIIMGEVNRQVEIQDFYRIAPQTYLNIIKQLMETSFRGELRGQQSPQLLQDSITELVSGAKAALA